jgi:Caspase domain
VSDGRHALVVATARYGDPKLQQLRAPAADAEELANVLGDPEKGDFDVEVVVDETHAHLTRAIARFFRDRSPQDLLLLHFSCHGVKDEDGELYLAASDTDLELLSATGISAAWLNERISRTRSRRTVVLLDCCFSGSFPSGLRARGDDVDAPQQLQGRGRAIITASNAMEYAYEGEQLKGRGRPSVFTEAVVEGLRTGEADLDQDQRVSIDDLYRYVYDRVRERTPSQTPSIKSDLEGPLYLARSTYRRPVEPAQLDPELLARTEDRYAGIREGAVQELAALLAAAPSVALAARHALLRMTSDDSRRVSARAQAALEAAEDAERAAGEAVERPPAEGDEAAERPPADAAEPPVAAPPPAVPPPAVPPEARHVAPPARRGPWRLIAAGAALAVIALAVVLVLIVGGGDGGGGDGGASPIPADNLTTNPSFESDTAGWDVSTATIATERTADAPDGEHVVRVRALTPGGDFAIDDSPDTIQSSVAGRRYAAAAWVKATESTNGELVCIGLRERAGTDGEPVSDSYAAGIATVGEFRKVGTFLVAEGTGNRISVHVFMDREEGGEGDAFLADAISIAEGPGGVTSDGGC